MQIEKKTNGNAIWIKNGNSNGNANENAKRNGEGM